jgi:hypothetical protein
MKTFLIKYTLVTYYYMQPQKGRSEKTIFVEAEDDIKAVKTLKKYWENKSDSFSQSFYVQDLDVTETIRQVDILK